MTTKAPVKEVVQEPIPILAPSIKAPTKKEPALVPIKCPKCSQALQNYDRFCPNCGARVK